MSYQGNQNHQITTNLQKYQRKFRQIDDSCLKVVKIHEKFVKLTKFLKVAMEFFPRDVALIFGN